MVECLLRSCWATVSVIKPWLSDRLIYYRGFGELIDLALLEMHYWYIVQVEAAGYRIKYYMHLRTYSQE